MSLAQAEKRFGDSRQSSVDARHLVAAYKRAKIESAGIVVPWDLLTELQTATINVKFLVESGWFRCEGLSCKLIDIGFEVRAAKRKAHRDLEQSKLSKKSQFVEKIQAYIAGMPDRVAVNAIRHKFTRYESMIYSGKYTYLALFGRVNRWIAIEFPNLRAEALRQIQEKGNG